MNKKEEIFTIGDKTTLGIITCFRLLDNEIMVDFDNKNSILLRSKKLQKLKKPLFTTEDGIDIYEGDVIWGINPLYFTLFSVTVKKGNDFHMKEWEHGKFSTEEKAEEYVYQNKPRFSFNDIETAYLKLRENETIPPYRNPRFNELINSLEKHCL
jgi:hypothetical protein